MGGGTKGKSREEEYQRVRVAFSESLKKLAESRGGLQAALDVDNVFWYGHLRAFRAQVREMERAVLILAERAFEEQVGNAEEAVEMLWSMLSFGGSVALRQLLRRKWLLVRQEKLEHFSK